MTGRGAGCEVALGRSDAAVGPDEVRRDEIVEAILRPRRVRAADARVRDQGVDRTEPGSRVCEGVVYRVSVANVAGEALDRAFERTGGLL